jgi:hypothetical protein
MLTTRTSLRVSDRNHLVAATGGGGTPPTYPSEVTGLEAWWDVSAHSWAPGEIIMNLPDTSGNGHHLVAHFPPGVQSTTYDDGALDGPNSAPYIKFINAFSVYKTAFTSFNAFRSTATAAHLWAVVRTTDDPPAAGFDGLWFFGDHSTGTDRYRDSSDSEVKLAALSDSVHTCGIWTDNLASWVMLEIESDAAHYTARTFGTVKYTTVTNTFGFPSQAWFGDSVFSPSPNYRGGLCEIILYDHVLSAGDRTILINYLNTKYFP